MKLMSVGTSDSCQPSATSLVQKHPQRTYCIFTKALVPPFIRWGECVIMFVSYSATGDLQLLEGCCPVLRTVFSYSVPTHINILVHLYPVVPASHCCVAKWRVTGPRALNFLAYFYPLALKIVTTVDLRLCFVCKCVALSPYRYRVVCFPSPWFYRYTPVPSEIWRGSEPLLCLSLVLTALSIPLVACASSYQSRKIPVLITHCPVTLQRTATSLNVFPPLQG